MPPLVVDLELPAVGDGKMVLVDGSEEFKLNKRSRYRRGRYHRLRFQVRWKCWTAISSPGDLARRPSVVSSGAAVVLAAAIYKAS